MGNLLIQPFGPITDITIIDIPDFRFPSTAILRGRGETIDAACSSVDATLQHGVDVRDPVLIDGGAGAAVVAEGEDTAVWNLDGLRFVVGTAASATVEADWVLSLDGDC